MKKLLLLVFTFTCLAEARACDICGCGVGGNYIGILPEFHKHIFGIRYRYNSLMTHIGNGGATTYLTSQENYHTTELWAGWNLGKKFRLMASVPYSFNERTNQGTTKSKNGPGDISVMGFYQLFYKAKTASNGNMLVHTLWLGGGLKLPTGKYTAADKENTSQNANLFQLGTGSVDLTINGMYDLRLQDAGLNISSSYKMNTANKYGYNYGNKFTAAAQLYYKWRIKKKFTVAPNAGMLYESAGKDIDSKILADLSGGNILAGTAGIETSYNKISVGANWQTPLSQNLANGIVKANNRLMLHLSFSL